MSGICFLDSGVETPMKISKTHPGNDLLPSKFWPIAALFAIAPIIALSGGCGGGSGGGIGATPTPNPTATVTPTAMPVVLFSNSRLALGNGQTGILNATRVGNAVAGTLTVTNSANALASISFHIPPNVYNISGTFSPPRGFTFSGTFPAPIGAFSFSGQVPTATQTGTFTLTAAGQTQSGIIPIIASPTPTPLPTTGPTTQPTTKPTTQPTTKPTTQPTTKPTTQPTTKPTTKPTTTPTTTGGGSIRASGGGTDTLSLTGTGSGVGANFSEAGYFAIAPSNGVTQLRLEGTSPKNDTSPYRDIVVSAFKTGTINVGDSFPIGGTTGQHGSVLYTYAPTGSSNGTLYYGISGTITITGATATGFNVSLSDVKINGIGAATGGANDFHTFSSGSGTGTYN